MNVVWFFLLFVCLFCSDKLELWLHVMDIQSGSTFKLEKQPKPVYEYFIFLLTQAVKTCTLQIEYAGYTCFGVCFIFFQGGLEYARTSVSFSLVCVRAYRNMGTYRTPRRAVLIPWHQTLVLSPQIVINQNKNILRISIRLWCQ